MPICQGFLAQCQQGANGHQANREDETEAGEPLDAQQRQYREGNDRGKHQVEKYARREADGGAGSLFGARREHQNDDRRESHREAAVGPCGDDPEQGNSANGNEGAAGIDQRGQPIRHPKPFGATTRKRPYRIGDEQRDAIERQRDTGEGLGCLVGEQPQRRRRGRQCDQSPGRQFATLTQRDRIADPSRGGLRPRRRSQFRRQVLEDLGDFPPLFDRRAARARWRSRASRTAP